MQTIESKLKEQKSGFLGAHLGTLCATLLGDLLASKGVIKAGEETIRLRQEFNVTSSFG